MEANKLGIGRGWSWIACGGALIARDSWAWLATGALFALLATVLLWLPFVGRLLLILIAPILAVGPLRAARDQARAETGTGAVAAQPPSAGARLGRAAGEAAARLFRGFGDPGVLMQMLVIGALALGVVVMLEIFAQLFRIGGHLLTTLPAALAGGTAPAALLPAMFGLLVLLTLQAALWMAALFAVPLIVLGDEMPLAAITASFRAASRNWLPLAVFGLVFALAFALLAALFALHWSVGYLALFTGGSLMLALFATSVYCSYGEVFVPSAP